jgi:ubiquinone/menaquinone biosynthesis C-methylase UbiE
VGYANSAFPANRGFPSVGPDSRTPHELTTLLDTDPTPSTAGRVIHWAFRYDLLVWVASRGRERAFREEQVGLARLAAGEFVLDIGCGTGAFAVAAKRRVGSTGAVHGIDASPEMIGRAHKKAQKAGVEVVFETAVAEALPFPDATFDAVLSTLVLHHLPKEALWQCIFEMRRVLKPGGRLLVLDIGGPDPARARRRRAPRRPRPFRSQHNGSIAQRVRPKRDRKRSSRVQPSAN